MLSKKKYQIIALLALMSCLSLYAAVQNPPREIYPIAQKAVYQEQKASLQNVIFNLSPQVADKFNFAGSDFNDFIKSSYGGNGISSKNVTEKYLEFIVTTINELSESLKDKVLNSEYSFSDVPKDNRAKQAFIIRSFLKDKKIYVIGQTPQASYYGLMALAQLVRLENNKYTIRGVDLVDWPVFEGRMDVGMSAGRLPKPKEAELMMTIRQAAMLRRTHGFYGKENYHAADALARGYRLGSGYWGVPRPKKIDPNLNEMNWSDPRIVEGLVAYARENAKGLPSLYDWHDINDDGWWWKYLKNWQGRDAIDKKNYPDDQTPARADIARFNKMYEAIRHENKDIDIMLTLPCYYDKPWDDTVKDIDLFREYLTTLGAGIPDDIIFILEHQGPKECAAYRKYMRQPVCNYIYVESTSAGGTWETGFIRAKENAGSCDIFCYCEGPGEGDFVTLCSAQYMWNSNLPTDTQWINENIVPRAAFLGYGPAWREMAEYFMMNLNVHSAANCRDAKKLRTMLKDFNHAKMLLNTAEQKIGNLKPEVKWTISTNKARVEKLISEAQQNLEISLREIDLKNAKFEADSILNENTKPSNVIKDGAMWQSAETDFPHWLEIALDKIYELTGFSLDCPSEMGYRFEDVDVQAWMGNQWVTITQGAKTKDGFLVTAMNAEFTNVKTNKIKFIFKKIHVWSTFQDNEPKDARVVSVRLYGSAADSNSVAAINLPTDMFSLDGTWLFKLDPDGKGKSKKWFEPSITVSDWHHIQVPAYWEQSEIENASSYDGAAWYRYEFNAPKEWFKNEVALIFEGIDDQADGIWLNGNFIGDIEKSKFDEPVRFIVTGKVNFDKPNLLVIKVSDVGDNGGIYKSVWLNRAHGPGRVGAGD